MQSTRIGELLSQQAHLTTHDVQEILAEQVSTRQPFGQIALQWGLVQPEDLWRAWFEQLTTTSPTVKLAKIGVDSRAVAMVPRQLAERLGVLPMRFFENQLLFAIDRKPTAELTAELSQALSCTVKFVVADVNDIQHGLRYYYVNAA